MKRLTLDAIRWLVAFAVLVIALAVLFNPFRRTRMKTALIALLVATGTTFGVAWIGHQAAQADAPYVVDATENAQAGAHPYRDTLVAQADTTAPVDAGVGAGTAAAPSATPKLPDPLESPQASASLLYKLYKAGHLIPMIVVAAFFLLTLLQKWIVWLRTGYRKLIVASAIAGLGMLAERAGEGTTPNLTMIIGAVGVAFAMWMKAKDEPVTS